MHKIEISTYVPRSLIAAQSVPPVATKSSMISTRSPGRSIAPTCISKQSVPYSRTYFSEITSPSMFSRADVSTCMLFTVEQTKIICLTTTLWVSGTAHSSISWGNRTCGQKCRMILYCIKSLMHFLISHHGLQLHAQKCPEQARETTLVSEIMGKARTFTAC